MEPVAPKGVPRRDPAEEDSPDHRVVRPMPWIRARRAGAVLTAVVAAAFLAGCTASAPAEAPGDSAEQLRSDITAYLDDPRLDTVRAVIVTVGDRTLVEEYFDSDAADYRNVFSVTKSVLSTLVGIAVDDGLLQLDATLAELLPAYAGSMSPQVGGTTLEQLLTMMGGFRDTWFGPDGGVFEQPDWVGACLQSAVRPPGETFGYSDPGVHLIGAVLAQATGRPVLDYAREVLFGPLGIDTEPAAEPLAVPANLPAYTAAGFAWPVDPQGIHTGFSYLKIRPTDMALLGSLYLHEGQWDGRQVVSEEWVHEATTAHVRARGATNDYGYLWWVGSADDSAAYMAVGYGGQLIEVVPDRELVVVIATEVGDHALVDHADLTYLVDSVIAPAVGR
jgi:CubicO group peptidase (beta-lactamase class C family)